MNPRSDDETRLSAEEEAFVRRLAGAWAPPERRPEQRLAFQAKLDARLRGRRGRLASGWMLVATAAAAAVALWMRTEAVEPLVSGTLGEAAEDLSGSAVTPEEAILAFVVEPEEAEPEEALPADYEAIASVFLDG